MANKIPLWGPLFVGLSPRMFVLFNRPPDPKQIWRNGPSELNDSRCSKLLLKYFFRFWLHTSMVLLLRARGFGSCHRTPGLCLPTSYLRKCMCHYKNWWKFKWFLRTKFYTRWPFQWFWKLCTSSFPQMEEKIFIGPNPFPMEETRGRPSIWKASLLEPSYCSIESKGEERSPLVPSDSDWRCLSVRSFEPSHQSRPNFKPSIPSGISVV